MLPKLTVVIPTYNRPRMLKRAVLSAVNQSYRNITIQIYDNSENGATEAYISSLLQADERVKYFRHKKNIGSIENFEFGLRRVETEYFCLISDDDIFAPDFFTKAITSLIESAADFICCQTIAMNESFEVISSADAIHEERIYEPGEAIDAMIGGGVPYKWSGIIFKKCIKDEVMINPLAGPYADSGFVLHVAARFKCVTKRIIGAIYFVHQNTASSSTSIIQPHWKRWWEEMILDIEKDYLVDSEIRHTIRDRMYPSFISIGSNQIKTAIVEGDYNKAIKVIDGLQKFGYFILSYLLRLIIKIILGVDFLRDTLDRFLQLRNQNKRIYIKKITTYYAYYVNYAKEISQV